MEFKNTTILVTGGSGFLGSHLCEVLLEKGAKVVCVDDLSQSSKSKISHLLANDKFTFVKADCNKISQIKKVFSNHKIEYVFHHAATVGVKRTLENPLNVLEDIEGIKNIFSLSYQYKVKKVVFASSSEVYGEPVELPEREDGALNAKLPYAAVKLIGESYCKAYWQKYQMPTTALRFFNVFGPRQEGSDYGFVVGIFMQQVIRDLPPTVVGDGMMTRNFVYVNDNIEITLKAMQSSQANGEVINVGTGEPITVLDLANKIIKISGKNLKPVFIKDRNPFEIRHRQPDMTKLKKILNFVPSKSLDDALAITYKWYQEANKSKEIILH